VGEQANEQCVNEPMGANELLSLTLTAANYVHLIEPQWNPSVEKQAIARAVRMGQTRQVKVIRYIAVKTVEEVCNSPASFRFVSRVLIFLTEHPRVARKEKCTSKIHPRQWIRGRGISEACRQSLFLSLTVHQTPQSLPHYSIFLHI